MAVETRVVNLSSSGAVVTGEAWIEGIYVNSTSSGTYKMWHGTTFANIGAPIQGGIRTPAIGWYPMVGLHTTAGVYVQMTGTLDVSIHIKEAN